MSHHDCLIWVGQSYPAIPDFLNEARTRGCCRKVPFWPAWARRGVTRVFLAHHDGLPAPDRGVIFGYFILGGVDIVLAPQDYDELATILATCRDANGDLSSEAHWDSEVGRRCAELMIEFWRQRAPDDPLPFKLRDWRGDLRDFIQFCLDLFLHSDNGDGMGSSALPVPTWQTCLETPRFCPLYGMRTAPERSGRPSFYFVDPLARLVDNIFSKILEERLTALRAADSSMTRGERLEKLAHRAAAPDENGRPRGLPEYAHAMEKAQEYLELHDPVKSEPRSFERRCGTMFLFKTPYPFYKSIPHASFRGLVQVDGENLLEQVERSSRHRSKSHEVKLPYVVEHSDRRTSKRKEELIVDMSTELKLSKSYSERVLDWLPEMLADELRSRRVIRLPNIGTFRLSRKEETEGELDDDSGTHETIDFRPSKALEREFGEIHFTASRVLARRT